MTRGFGSRSQPAQLPPDGLPGLDRRWSRLVPLTDADGILRTFHVLDSWAGTDHSGTDHPGADHPGNDHPGSQPVVTLLCVHGNPTWSYLWRRLLAAAPADWRVLAVDQLGMGYSERIDRPRRLTERVEDLHRLTGALNVRGPVVTVAHDWGGIISLGWALRSLDQLAGVVLTNTAVAQPDGTAGPAVIRLAALPPVTALACVRTPLFVRATTSLTRPGPPAAVRRAFAAPYRTWRRRLPVGEFVADIPFRVGHPSYPAVAEIAAGVAALTTPALLLWGPRDPVFSDVYLRDLQRRLPHAQLHRYERASHLLPEDAPGYADAVLAWVRQLPVCVGPATQPDAPDRSAGQHAQDSPSVLAQLTARATDDSPAVDEMGGERISWRQLDDRVRGTAAGLIAAGVRPGHRVALLIPPSIDLTVALYAVWQAGGVIVVADTGLGLRGMGRALRGAQVDHLIADTAGLLAARGMRLPGSRLSLRPKNAVVRRLGRVDAAVGGAERTAVGSDPGTTRQPLSAGDTIPFPTVAANDEAAVLFTSGATGPAKGVLYRHRQVRAQLALIRSSYGLTADDRIVAAFAPFALYGPALGLRSVVPDTDVTRPGRLTAAALADAAAAVEATVVFASPAALRNVVATAAALTPAQHAALATVRLVMSAGASVPAALLRRVQTVLTGAELHTPYGMTEALPLTDISLAGIEAAGPGDGVCVGLPLPGVTIAIAPLAELGVPAAELTAEPGVTGEIWARAEHIRDRYDASFALDAAAATHPGWHLTGDVGMLDEQGRLWVQGRSVHLITASTGPVTPTGIELRVEAALEAAAPVVGSYAGAAAVGVGPAGTQQVVVVLAGPGRPLAPALVTKLVRQAAGADVAAVLVLDELPVDIRHNSKIDRTAVARWAAKVLAGG